MRVSNRPNPVPTPRLGPALEHLSPLLVVLTQQLASLSIDKMYPGAGGTDDRPVLVFGNIWIVVQLVLDFETGRRTPENEMAHFAEIDRPTAPDHDLAQGSP